MYIFSNTSSKKVQYSILERFQTGLVSLGYLLSGWRLLLTPGLRKRLMCLCRRAWFCWFPAQKFCRNWWANFIMSCMRRSSPWEKNYVLLCLRWPFLHNTAFLFLKVPSHMGSAATPEPRRAHPCSAATSAAAFCSSCPRDLLGHTACWAAAGSKKKGNEFSETLVFQFINKVHVIKNK